MALGGSGPLDCHDGPGIIFTFASIGLQQFRPKATQILTSKCAKRWDAKHGDVNRWSQADAAVGALRLVKP